MSWGFVPKLFYTIKPRKFMSRLGKTDGIREKRGHEFNFDIFLVVDSKTQIKQTLASKRLLTKIRKELQAKSNLDILYNVISVFVALFIAYLVYYFIFHFINPQYFSQ